MKRSLANTNDNLFKTSMDLSPETQSRPKWIYTHELLSKIPSIVGGMSKIEELNNRQISALMISMAGRRLKLIRLVTNTAIVYMHRFYMIQTMQKYSITEMSPVFLHLATKIEEDCKPTSAILEAFKVNSNDPNNTRESKLTPELLFKYEKILIQTLGFEFIINHPHEYINNSSKLLKLPKDIVNTAYFLATYSLHVSYFSVTHTPQYLCALCLDLACRWAKYEIKTSKQYEWYQYIEKDLELPKFDQMIQYLDDRCTKCPDAHKTLLCKNKIYDSNGVLRSYPQPTNMGSSFHINSKIDDVNKAHFDDTNKRKINGTNVELKKPKTDDKPSHDNGDTTTKNKEIVF